MSDLLDGLAAIANARPEYRLAEDYYEGRIAEYFANERLGQKLTRGGRQRYAINFAKTPVNVLADRLEVAAVSVTDDEVTSNLLQDEFWDANQLSLEIPEALKKTLMYGDGYLFVWEGDTPGTVDVWFNSPLGTRAMYDPENPRRILYVAKTWKAGEFLRATLYYPERIERYITNRPGLAGESEADWIPYIETEGEAWPALNEYGIPLFHLRTALPYGRPAHRDAYGPQDAMTKLIVTMMETTDAAGTPWRYALMRADAALTGESTLGRNWGSDSEATDADRSKTDLSGQPGDFTLLDGIEAVGQLEAADPKHFLDPAEFVLRAMAQTTGTPLHYMDPSGDAPSGESRRAQDAPLVKTARFMQMLTGSGISSAAEFALKILGKPDTRVDVRWVPSAATDDMEAWTTAGLKKANGVPGRQVLLEQGYVAEQVDAWIAANGEDTLAQRVSLLGEIGKAVQALGTGISLGAVTSEAVQEAVENVLFPAVTGEVAPEVDEEQLLMDDPAAAIPITLPVSPVAGG